MPSQLAEPLPECLACETPTKRATYRRTGGFCSPCDPTPPDPARAELADWQRTVARIRGEERRRAQARAATLAARRNTPRGAHR